MKRKLFLSSSVLCLCLAVSQDAAAQKKEDILLAEIKQIQAQLAQLQSSQAALQQIVEGLVGRASEQQDSLRKTLADSTVTFERIQQDMSILSERVEETNERIGSVREEIVSLRQSREALVVPAPEPLAVPAGSAPAPSGAEEAGSGETPSAPAAVVAAAPTVTDIYNQARIDYTQGRYPLAISGFKDVLQLDSRGQLADNAHYWMGETYLAQRQHELAIEQFDKVIRDYPQSNKRPDAYLKKAMTLDEMGRRSEANTMYELVIEQFPNTSQERVARRKLEEMMRTTVQKPQR
jgi:tol-pal system protein YbgF